MLEDCFFEHLPAARSGNGDDLFAGLCEARTADGESFSDEDGVNHMPVRLHPLDGRRTASASGSDLGIPQR